MPLSSYLGKSSRRIGGAWPPSSVLPSAAKSKLPSSRKSRKRTALINFFFSHFITIAVSVSFLFFFLTIFLYGFKSKPSGLSHYGSVRQRRPSFNLRRANRSGFGATVDITTKELYDKIEFLDVDGGPWKQGWRVTYKGNEWDDEKLKVFVVPHSHNDPGWKLTVEEYYDRQSRHILDTIVETLSKDTRRKFIWEEMSYLERWWRDSPDIKREAFINLVNNGQLEIVGGGWVMNDEANSHFYSIIEQITEGNMWLNDTIGFIPRNSWAIDPFGYSPTMAYLLRRMGFENMLIQRTHYELKKELALNKNLEYIWRQSWDAEESTDIFVHMMPFYSYDIPHTCGPEPAVCCQFDFARLRGFTYEYCPWQIDPVETTAENVQDRALKLLDQYKKKSMLYRTNTLLIPLGDDFRYINVDEAEAQFRNYQMLFDYINSNPSLNTVISFGTLEDYFRTVREEAERVNYSRTNEVGSALVSGFPSLSGDFFTYADREKDYWSGYYVSRPFFKAVDRVLEHTLRSSEILMAFLFGHCQRPQCEKLPTGFSYKLTAARRNLALFQHHDGVTGTAKDHVVQDYGVRMHTSLQDLQIFMAKAIEVLLGVRHDKSEHSPSQFEPEQIRSKYDAMPMHKVIGTHEGTAHSVVFFNPLEQQRDEVVTVVVDRHDVSVLDSNWTCIPSQVSPDLRHDKNKVFTGRHRLHWRASVPAMGLQMYYIASGGSVGCEKAKHARLKISSPSDESPSCPAHYTCSKIEGDEIEIRNKHQTLTFGADTGLLRKVTRPDGSVNVVDEEIGMYSSKGSGAYLFKPTGDSDPIVGPGGFLLVSEGMLMKEVFSYPKTQWDRSPISHSTRIYQGDNVNTVQEHVIETEYHVEMKGHDFNDKELIVRFKSDIDNNRIFYSDLNGFQMARREYYDKIPLQGNYYPIPALGFLHGSNGQRFSVHSRQSLGGASIKNGWLEIMLDRRLSRDDGRGLGQGVMDNRAMKVVFHIMFESNVSSAASNNLSSPIPMSPSLLSHNIGAHLNHPLHAFVSKKPQETTLRDPTRSFAPLASPLPCDIHIVSFKVPRPVKYSQQIGSSRFALTVQRRHWDSSYCKTARSTCSAMGSSEPVNLFNIFRAVSVQNVRMTSLNLLHEDPEIHGYSEQGSEIPNGNLNIAPMEIQAYKLELRPHQ